MRDGDLFLRTFDPEDEETLEALLAEPEVKRWWFDSDYDRENGWAITASRSIRTSPTGDSLLLRGGLRAGRGAAGLRAKPRGRLERCARVELIVLDR